MGVPAQHYSDNRGSPGISGFAAVLAAVVLILGVAVAVAIIRDGITPVSALLVVALVLIGMHSSDRRSQPPSAAGLWTRTVAYARREPAKFSAIGLVATVVLGVLSVVVSILA